MAARNQVNSAPGPRSLVAAALLALGLAIWRGVATLPAEDVPVSRSQFESRISEIAATLTGPRAVRVSATEGPAGSRQILILLNQKEAPASVSAPMLADLFAAAGLFDEAAGDRLDIRETVFAPQAISRPTGLELAEIIALFGLAGWIGWIALVSGRSSGPVIASTPSKLARPEPSRPSDAPYAGAMLAAARNDPVRTARVVRAWLSTEDAR